MKCRILATSLLFSVSALFAGGTGETIDARGVVEYLEGEVTLNGVAAEIGQEIELKTTVRTGAASYCEIVFWGGNIFRLEENTTAVIEIDADHHVIDLQQGALAAVFAKLQLLGSMKNFFGIKTRTAVAGIRGAAFFIRVEDADSTYICTCNGHTELSDARNRLSRKVSAGAHKAFRFSRQNGSSEVVSATLLYHDNATIDPLAERIGETISWGTAP